MSNLSNNEIVNKVLKYAGPNRDLVKAFKHLNMESGSTDVDMTDATRPDVVASKPKEKSGQPKAVIIKQEVKDKEQQPDVPKPMDDVEDGEVKEIPKPAPKNAPAPAPMEEEKKVPVPEPKAPAPMEDEKEGYPRRAGHGVPLRRSFEPLYIGSGIEVPAFSACSPDDADVRREFRLRVELKDKTYGTEAGYRNTVAEIEKLQSKLAKKAMNLEALITKECRSMREDAVRLYCLKREMRTHTKQRREVRTQKMAIAEAMYAQKQAMKKLKEDAQEKREALKALKQSKPSLGGRKRARLNPYIDDEAEEVDVPDSDDDDHYYDGK